MSISSFREKYKATVQLAIRLLNLTKSGLPSKSSGKNNVQPVYYVVPYIYFVTVFSSFTIFLLTFSEINSSTNIYCARYEDHQQIQL